MRDVADDADRARTDQKAPEEPDRAVVVPLGDLDLGGHRVPLLAVRSYVTVRSPTSTTILASTPSAVRYDASVLISMSPWRSILLICACPTPSLAASSVCVSPTVRRIAARSIMSRYYLKGICLQGSIFGWPTRRGHARRVRPGSRSGARAGLLRHQVGGGDRAEGGRCRVSAPAALDFGECGSAQREPCCRSDQGPQGPLGAGAGVRPRRAVGAVRRQGTR